MMVCYWPIGFNTQGQANPFMSFVQWPRSFDAGDIHTIVASANGTVMVWGGGLQTDDACVRQIPAGLTEVVKVAAGAYHNLALREDGTVVGWGGLGSNCALNPPTYPAEAVIPVGLTRVVDIAAGNGISAAIRANGEVVVWGSGCKAPTLTASTTACMLASKRVV
jgi:alpha-tubulin suppressor-like RCC1 family protein